VGLKEDDAAWGVGPGGGHGRRQDAWYHGRAELGLRGLQPTLSTWGPEPRGPHRTPRVLLPGYGRARASGLCVLFVVQSLWFSSSSTPLLSSPLTWLRLCPLQRFCLCAFGLPTKINRSCFPFCSLPCGFCNDMDFDGSPELCLPVLRASLSVSSYSWQAVYSWPPGCFKTQLAASPLRFGTCCLTNSVCDLTFPPNPPLFRHLLSFPTQQPARRAGRSCGKQQKVSPALPCGRRVINLFFLVCEASMSVMCPMGSPSCVSS